MATPAEIAAMRRALELARMPDAPLGPNPRVGCVLLDPGGAEIAEGYGRGAGSRHAEIDALRAAGDRAVGATAVVTLEPCNHTGRTGPCAEALRAAGIARVVFGQADANPVARGGAEALRAAGIEVEAAPAPAVELPPDAEAVLAWAVREGATNVLRHADARHVRISVAVNRTDAALELVDDGCGRTRTEERPGADDGTGLAGLAERVARVRGRMDAAPGAGGGFRLAVTVPLEAVS